jgi:hypothetical protein
MRREKVEVEAEFKAKGLGKLKAQWLDFAGDLVEPVALLAAGATKAQAAWAGMRGVFLTRVLGPLGLVAGAAAGFLLTTKKLVGEWKQLGMRSSAALERMTLQFRPLLGSMELARKRVKELFEFTAKTPFRLESVAQANKILQNLTKGALATKEGMTLVGDSAAVADAGLANTATMVGRLYDGLQSGRPVGEASMRLQEMGLISGQTRNQIESMQAANVAGNEVWKIVEKELRRNEGAMKDLSETLEGLESTAADVRQQMQAGFSGGFMEGEKAGIKATTQAMEKLTPVAEYFGEVFGRGSNMIAKFKANLLNAVTGWDGFTGAAKAAAGGVLLFMGAVTVATGAAIGKFVAGILSATVAKKALIKATGGLAAAETAETAVTARLTVAKAQLAAAKVAVARGSTMEAVGATRVAAAETLAALKTNGMAASQIILRGALRATGVAIRFVLVQLRMMLVAIVTNPWMALATALLAVGAYLVNLSIATERARKALEGYKKATDDLNRSMQEQLASARTVADLRKVEADVVRELAQAYRDLEQATAKGDDSAANAARERVQVFEERKKAARNVDPNSLERGSSALELEAMLREREREARLSSEDFAARGPEEQAGVAKRRFQEQDFRRNQAGRDMEEEERVRARQDALRRGGEDRELKAAGLRGKASALRGELAAQANMENVGAFETAGEMQAKAKAWREELAAVEKQLLELESAGRGGILEEGLNSGSELQRLKTQVALYDELESAVKAEGDARRDLAAASDEERSGKEAALAAAVKELEVVRALNAAHGTIGSARGRQDAGVRIQDLEKRRKDDLDPAKREAARQERESAEFEVERARVDAASQVASLRLRGFEAEKMMLDFEREKLELARERGQIGEAAYGRERDILDARNEAMRREARERGESLQAAFEESRLRRLAEDARLEGDQPRAKALQREADERADARRRAELEREARQVTSDPASQRNFVNSRLREERAARSQARREEERDRSLGRQRTEAELGRSEAALRARGLRGRGETSAATKLEEEAARREDAVRKQELEREFLGKGFGAAEAASLAGRQVQVDQANRLLERFGSGGATVVADSLAQVGGGGGVAGRDRSEELLERIEKVLQSIEDNTDGEGGIPIR